MNDREKLHVGVRVERLLDVVGVDGVVVADGELDGLASVLFDEELEPFTEDAGDEVQDLVARRDQGRRRGFEPEDRFALQDDDVVLRAVDLLQEPARSRS